MFGKGWNPRRKAIFVVLTVVGLALCEWIWARYVKDQIYPKRWGVVAAGTVYRSGQLSALLVRKTLDNHGIRVIVSLGKDEEHDRDCLAEIQAAEALEIKRINLPLKGNGTGDIHTYAKTLTLIQQAAENGKPLLVHCAAGAQRTGGVVAAYRLLVEKKSAARVYQEMQRYGWDPQKNPKLLFYLNGHMAELAKLLVKTGVLEQVPDPLPMLPL